MRSLHLRLAGLLLLAATAACHDAPTQPAAPSPTPVPVMLDLNGKWTGTIDYDPSGDGSCPVHENIETTVEQNQTDLFIQFPTQCFRTVYIYGKVALDQNPTSLSFTVNLGNDIEIASMAGTATNSQIDASTRNVLGKGYPSSLHLKR